MAQRLALHYIPGNSSLHRWDARCKFLGLSILSIFILRMEVVSLGLFSALLVAAVIIARLPLRPLLRDMRGWVFFLLIIFLLQAFFYPEAGTSGSSWFHVSGHGVQRAAAGCWRLGLILCYAVLFTGVTRPRELQEAITWLLRPLPFVPARRIGLMVALTIHLLPLMLDQSEAIHMATKSRLMDQGANPFRRIKCYVLPLFRHSLIRADRMALALAARGYRDDLPVVFSKVPWRDSLALGALILVVMVATVGPLG